MSAYSDMMPDLKQRRTDPASNANSPNLDWITSDAPHKQVTAVVRRLIRDQNLRLIQAARFESLYANEDLLRTRTAVGDRARPSMPRQTLNLIKVHSDTLAGKLVQSNSRVQAMTIEGDWKTFKLARKLGRLLDTTFLQGRLFRECSKVVLDAIKTGIGYLYIGEYDGKISYERWYPHELFVDELDAMYGNPSMLFRVRYMYPENALGLWGKTPEAAEAIRKAPRAQPPAFGWVPYEQGMIEVFEAWALELGSRKGRHVLCTAAGTIQDGKYKSDKFPVVAFRAADTTLGWYGQGFTAHSAGTQIWLNRVLDIMSRAAHLGMAPFWTVSGNADISIKQLNNVEGHVVTSNGPEPKWNTNPPFHPSATQYVELLTQQMGILYGINEMESSGQMPLNRLDSNPALIQAQDIWMARHTILLKNWSEEFYMDVAERTVEVAQRIAKSKGSYPVVATERGRAWAMDWKDFVELDREHYRLTLAAENALPLTPAARKKMILEWAAEGQLTQDQALQMFMGSADIDSLVSQITAYQNNADWIIEQLMEGEEPELSALQRPDVVLQRVRAAGLMAQEYKAPAEVVLGFETFAARLTDQISQTQADMMPPPGASPDGGSSAGIATAPTAGLETTAF